MHIFKNRIPNNGKILNIKLNLSFSEINTSIVHKYVFDVIFVYPGMSTVCLPHQTPELLPLLD